MAGKKWTPERRAKFSKTAAAKRAAKKAGDKATEGSRQSAVEGAHTTTGILTYLRHGAAEVLLGIQRGDITLRTLAKKDALMLLAFVETRG